LLDETFIHNFLLAEVCALRGLFFFFSSLLISFVEHIFAVIFWWAGIRTLDDSQWDEWKGSVRAEAGTG